MTKKLSIMLASAAALAIASPAQAQWVGFNANNNGAEFWDNQSSDGANCNIGHVVTGIAGTAENLCNNQRPVGWLPFTNLTPAVDEYWNNSTFVLFGGTLAIRQAAGQGGDIAGANQAWGYWTSTTLGGTKTVVDVNPVLPLASTSLSGLYWGLWVNTVDGGNRFSDVDGQFALFRRSAGTSYSYVFGLEDTMRGGDMDFQDMIAEADFTGTVVPEPSTYALMVAGLAAIGMASRRRRSTIA